MAYGSADHVHAAAASLGFAGHKKSVHPITILVLGIAMSTDAFAAAIGVGAAMRRPRLREALRAGMIFGTIEALTPVIGWLAGRAASGYIEAWDHWIAFVLLGLLGLHMIHAGMRTGQDAPAIASARHTPGFWRLALTALATSIDAMALGVGLAFLDVNIAVVTLVIGVTTFVLVTIGILLGRILGDLAGKRAEVVGGVLLIAIGAAILHEHL